MVYLYEIIFNPQNGRKNINDYCIISDLSISAVARLFVDKHAIFDKQGKRHVCQAVEMGIKQMSAKEQTRYKLLFDIFTQNWVDSSKRLRSLSKSKETIISDVMKAFDCSEDTAVLFVAALQRKGLLTSKLVKQYEYDYEPAFATFRLNT